MALSYTVSRKKGPPWKWKTLELCQILTDFQTFCTARKRIKFATKRMQHYPPDRRYVATPPWEIENLDFLHVVNRYGRKCKHIAF